MPTQLRGKLTRAIEHDGYSYRVELSSDGIRIIPKGHRRGAVISWARLIQAEDGLTADVDGIMDAPPGGSRSARKLGMSDNTAADVLLLLRSATDALTDAAALINRASELPAILANGREPRAPSDRQRSDWFIEPLLSVKEVATILGVSPRSVRRLPLRPIELGGQVRYQPAELRSFFAKARASR